MKDSLGDRMKNYYEDRVRYSLPRRTYTIIRIDGKAFHTYTRGLNSPFDDDFMNDIDETACYLCKNAQGAKFGFVQSDEISILLTDFDQLTTDAWFDGNIQKIASISASLATAKFNQLRLLGSIHEVDGGIGSNYHADNIITEYDIEYFKLALFDSRVFTIPSYTEVENYFIWRQQDTVRNSISSVAQSLFSHKELEGKNTTAMQEMCFQKGVNWNDYAPKYKRGRLIIKEYYEKEGANRSRWVSSESPVFTQERNILSELIPKTD